MVSGEPLNALILIASLIVMLIAIAAEIYLLATVHMAWPAGGQRLWSNPRNLVRQKLLNWRNLAFLATTLMTLSAVVDKSAPFLLAALAAFIFFAANVAVANRSGLFDKDAPDGAKGKQKGASSFALPAFGSFLNLYLLVFLLDLIAVIANFLF